MEGLTRGDGGFHAQDAFNKPVVLPVQGLLCIAKVQEVVRSLSQAVGMSPAGTLQLMVGASELAGLLFQGAPREGKISLRLLKNKNKVGMEMALECAGDAASRLVVRKWDS